jgi:hypothetical protein
MAFEAKILCDSINDDGNRLTTLQVTLPRIVLSEFNTHRVFSRNSASSRAIPVEKRIEAVKLDPFIPEAFGKNQKGMSASEDLDEEATNTAKRYWLDALDKAVNSARLLAGCGVHKQLANRLLEPFCWQTIIVSSTEWSNFFALRCHPDAQPEIRKAAELIRLVLNNSLPRLLKCSEWHLPLVPDYAELKKYFSDYEICLISAARCARVSYLTHDGKRDPNADLILAQRLSSAGHMSPFEHVAYPHLSTREIGNFRGWTQLRASFKHENDYQKILDSKSCSVCKEPNMKSVEGCLLCENCGHSVG